MRKKKEFKPTNVMQEVASEILTMRILEKALELACKEVPTHHCPCPPEKIDMTNEYGSDTPVYIYDNYCDCEDGSECLNCCITYFKKQAEKKLGEKE